MSIAINNNPYYATTAAYTTAQNSNAAATNSEQALTNNKATDYDTVSLSVYANKDLKELVVAFDVYKDSFIRNVHDSDILPIASGNRDSYYGKLFELGIESTNKLLEETGLLDNTYAAERDETVQGAVARYEVLREEVIKTFGHDEELLAKNMDSLDRAFGGRVTYIAHLEASRLANERQMNWYAANRSPDQPRDTDLPERVYNKISTHSDFDGKKFQKHASDMMAQFAQKFTEQIKTGFGYSDAWGSATAFMNQLFGVTTSVNNLSFNDFMLLQAANYGDADISTVAGAIEAYNNNNNWFNNNPDMSKELRALLG